MNNHLCSFSSGLEQADLLLSSGLLNRSWEAIVDTHNHVHPQDPSSASVKYKVHQLPSNGTIIAFVSTAEATLQHLRTEGLDMVSSEELKLSSFNVFDFVGTKVNPSFAIHRAAAVIFSSLLDKLTLLKNQLDCSNPLIVTGHCLGGSIALLFAAWLFNDITQPTSKRPICITFGSPLLGDKRFQQAVAERPAWNFVNVVSNKDLVPHIFTSYLSGVCTYQPFGTYLLCSESGCACIDDSDTVLRLLMEMGSNFVGNSNLANSLDITDYGLILHHLMDKSLCRGVSLVTNALTNLQAGIMMDLTAVGVQTQGNSGSMDSLATYIAERAKNLVTRKRNVYDRSKKLAERKLDYTYLEWYKKISQDQGGYYDCYKNKQSGSREQIRSREEIIKRHRILTQYWKRMVDEVEKMPQTEGANFRIRWLYAGTNYRLMVEPLDIADYYSKGRRGYMAQRPQHYVLLEKWCDEDVQLVKPAKERNKACYLTEDSCFWAHVEEAIISCKVLRHGGCSSEDVESLRDNLIGFEKYVMHLIRNFAVSPDIFLQGSSFMQWWEEYSATVGNSYNSPLIDFMRNHHYRNYN